MSDLRGKAIIGTDVVKLEIEVPLNPRPGAGESPPRAISHGSDFASVKWGDRVYHFSPKQRAVVAELIRAREQGYGWVSQEALLDLADSESGRLRFLFKDHPAWGTMIVCARDTEAAAGSYRLADPPA